MITNTAEPDADDIPGCRHCDQIVTFEPGTSLQRFEGQSIDGRRRARSARAEVVSDVAHAADADLGVAAATINPGCPRRGNCPEDLEDLAEASTLRYASGDAVLHAP